jgi:hypothetical protein
MILELPDGSFGNVSAVHAEGDKLELYFLITHVLFKEFGTFIVESL